MEQEITAQNRLFGKTFFWMFLGLLGSAIVAWYTYSSGLFLDIILGDYFGILLIVELVAVLLFSLLFRKLPPVVVGILYFVYSMLNGVTLSTVFVVFELNSIVYLFVISALIFAVLGFIGYKTNKDLSRWSTYISVFLIAGILLSVINLVIFKNSTFDLIISIVLILIFIGLTAYDVQQIIRLGKLNMINEDNLAIYGALDLYLDYINLFIQLLSIFGERK